MNRFAALLVIAACGGKTPPPKPPDPEPEPKPEVAAVSDAAAPDAAAPDGRYCDGVLGLIAAAGDGFETILGDETSDANIATAVFVSTIQVPDGRCLVAPYEDDGSFVRCDLFASSDIDEVRRVHTTVGKGVMSCLDPAEWEGTQGSFTRDGRGGVSVGVGAHEDGAGTHHVQIYVYPTY